MTISTGKLSTKIEYPDTDGLPMAESDFQSQYLTYAVEAIPRLLELGLSVEQVAGALGLSVQQVRQAIQE